MTSVSALNHIHKIGHYGNYENKSEENLLKILEIKNMLIVQIVQYKNSTVSFENINIDNLKLKNEPQNVVSNNDTRILWNGPKNWLLVSTKKNLLNKILESFINFREEVVTKRTVFELNKARERAHLLIGFVVTNDHIDEIINLIKYQDILTSKYHQYQIFYLKHHLISLYLRPLLYRLNSLRIYSEDPQY